MDDTDSWVFDAVLAVVATAAIVAVAWLEAMRELKWP